MNAIYKVPNRCPKCDAQAMSGPQYCRGCGYNQNEHMHERCMACGFQRLGPTLDKKERQQWPYIVR